MNRQERLKNLNSIKLKLKPTFKKEELDKVEWNKVKELIMLYDEELKEALKELETAEKFIALME